MKFDLFPVVGTMIELNRSNTKFGEGNGTPLQYSCLEEPMDGGAWKAAVHGVAEGQTQLSDFTFMCLFGEIPIKICLLFDWFVCLFWY